MDGRSPIELYELAQHMERGVGRLWPPSARSNLFNEPRKLVSLGLANATKDAVGNRPRTVYPITGKGTAGAQGLARYPRRTHQVINGQDLDVLDDIVVPELAAKLRRAFAVFRAAFPDWHQELVEVVAEDDTVVARFRCTGTHQGRWQGLEPTGRTMRIDEVYFFGVSDGRILRMWGLEDTWTRIRQLGGDDEELGQLGSLS